jgi:hypothetical protein
MVDTTLVAVGVSVAAVVVIVVGGIVLWVVWYRRQRHGVRTGVGGSYQPLPIELYLDEHVRTATPPPSEVVVHG